MSDPTLDQFMATLTESHLLSTEQVKRLMQRLLHGEKDLDAQRVARSLVEGGHLSLWQAQQILAGRTAFFLGRYKLLDRIGKGGMGVVFKAQHGVMDRTVALKVMSHALLNNERALARFAREVKAAAALNHRNIITAYDADCVGSTHFLAMEYVEGYDLNAWLRRRGPLPISLACECAMQAAKGLAHASRCGMVHRDIKPVNMLVAWDAERERPVVKILDMGLARFVSETHEDGGITREGHMVGTPDYVAPEAAENFKTADIRADIFSLGCSLFKLLTGKLPFPGNNAMEKLLARTRQDAPPVSKYRRGVSEELEQIVAKMLARNPRKRFQIPQEVVSALAPLAASTLGDEEALGFFAPPEPSEKVGLPPRIEPDLETSLEEFFQDFATSPARTEEMAVEPGADRLPKQNSPRAPRSSGSQRAAATVVDPLDDLLGAPSGGETFTGFPDTSSPSSRSSTPDLLAEISDLPSGALQELPRRRRRWDSPLVLLGVGGLLLLLFVGGLMFWRLTRQTGDESLRLADEDYRSGAYSQAIQRYTDYLHGFPSHSGVSAARVRRGLAQLRQVVEGGGDWPRALKTAESVLGKISTEASFGEARPELAGLLPPIAEGLAAEAKKQQDAGLVEQAQAALGLIHKYVPTSLRPTERIEEVQRSLALTTRTLKRKDALDHTIQAINKASAGGKTSVAYERRTALLRDYPGLEKTPELHEAELAIVEAEQRAIASEDVGRAALKEQAKHAAEATFILTAGEPAAASTPRQAPVFAMAGNAIYAIDTGRGKLLWRRKIGSENLAAAPPIARLSSGDVLLLDSGQRELLRLGSGDGALRWRQSLDGQPVGSPLVVGPRVLVALSSGQVAEIDLASGELSRMTKFPQRLAVGPVASPGGDVWYQLEDHSSLCVISSEDGICRQGFYVGHRPSTVTTRPLLADRYLIISEADRLSDSRLTVLLLDEDGLISKVAQQLRIDGGVHVAPVISGGKIFVVTDVGAIYAFELTPPGHGEPLRQVARTPAASKNHMLRFYTAAGNRLWVADDRLTLYELQPAQGRLMPRWIRYAGDIFLQSPTSIGERLFSVRRPATHAGVVAAMSPAKDEGQLWQLEIASPVLQLAAREETATPGGLALTAGGDLFEIEAASQEADVVLQPRARIDPLVLWLENATIGRLSKDRWFIAPRTNTDRLVLVDRHDGAWATSWLTLPDQLGGAPVAWAGRLVIPGRSGQIHVVDPATGDSPVEPFQPRMTNAAEFSWQVSLLPKGNELLLADNRGGVFLIGVDRQPKPHLVARAETALDTPLASPLVVIESTAYGKDTFDRLVTIELPKLTPGASPNLGGRIIHGPSRIGGLVLSEVESASSDDENLPSELWCFDGSGEPKWHAAVPRLTWPPAAAGDGFIVAAHDGRIQRLSAESGTVESLEDVHDSLSTGPLATGNHMLLGTRDGEVKMVPLP